MTITVKRGGVSTVGWYATDIGANVYARRDELLGAGSELVIAFDLPSRSLARTTAVQIEFTTAEFATVALAMFRADPIAAATAFGCALAQGFPAQPSLGQQSAPST